MTEISIKGTVSNRKTYREVENLLFAIDDYIGLKQQLEECNYMKQEKLLQKIIANNPELPIKFMYPADNFSDFAYGLGAIDKIVIEEIWIEDDRIWTFPDDYDECMTMLEDCIYSDLYPEKYYSWKAELTEEEFAILEQKTKEEFNELDFQEAIMIYIKGE